MRNKADRQFWETAMNNNATFIQYYRRLVELAVSSFEWKNLPDTVDPRFLELALFTDGYAVWFKDEELGDLALRCTLGGTFNVYNIPKQRRAYASNGYNRILTDKDSVIIYNNQLRTNSMLDVRMFSERLYNLDRAIDVNANAQKTPIAIKTTKDKLLTIKNVYKNYDGNSPVIIVDEALDLESAFKVVKTDAPYVCDKLYELKTQIWNEALTYLGIDNVSFEKKERLVDKEAIMSAGGTLANRYSRLEARRQACKQVNEMFGTDIWCDFRDPSTYYTSTEGGVDSE